MTILPALASVFLMAQAPPAGPTAIDRERIVIRDGAGDRPEAEADRPPPAPGFPVAASFWTPTRLAIGIVAVIAAGVMASVVVARSEK